jgi:hypothetical protein
MCNISKYRILADFVESGQKKKSLSSIFHNEDVLPGALDFQLLPLPCPPDPYSCGQNELEGSLPLPICPLPDRPLSNGPNSNIVALDQGSF